MVIAPQKNHFEIDPQLAGFHQASGIDEVGRGCLAGPVVVAAVTWRLEQVAQQPWFAKLTDSKKLDAACRAELLPHILRHASYVRVAFLNHMVIDQVNILRATLHGFELVAPPYQEEVPLFIDGNQKPPSLPWARTLVKGDARMSAIAAASVVAKVMRDALLIRLGALEPVYGFQKHMGYATAHHRQALSTHGPGRYHRKSFAPISHMREHETPEDEVWVRRIEAVPQHQLAGLWDAFTSAYADLSLPGARRAMTLFQNRGINLFPSGRDQRPFS